MFRKIIIIAVMALPGILYAQEELPVDYSEPISILTWYSLASAIALGVVTSVVVIINGRRMKGGVFGGALYYLGIGMFIVLVGTISSFFPSIAPEYLEGTLPNLLNTIGYVIMAIAASRLLRATRVE